MTAQDYGHLADWRCSLCGRVVSNARREDQVWQDFRVHLKEFHPRVGAWLKQRQAPRHRVPVSQGGTTALAL